METVQRGLNWARGRLIGEAAADVLLQQTAQYIQEVQTAHQHEQQGKTQCTGDKLRSGEISSVLRI